MKNSVWKITGLFVLALLGLASCDVIENPIKDGGVVNPVESDTVYRNVFIEDFTGHRCKNCPKASKEIEALVAFYGDRIIPLAIHSGSSVFTAPNPPDYPTDFTTQDGDDIAAAFGGVPAQPIGMVNRMDYTGSSIAHWKTYSNWTPLSASFMDELAIADIKMTATINGSNIETDAKVTFLGDQNGTYDIAVYLKEDNIVAPQLLPTDVRDPDYVHHNVFRTAITAPMGESLASGAISDSTEFTASYSTALDPSWDEANLQVIGIIFDNTTREVMQAVQVDVE